MLVHEGSHPEKSPEPDGRLGAVVLAVAVDPAGCTSPDPVCPDPMGLVVW